MAMLKICIKTNKKIVKNMTNDVCVYKKIPNRSAAYTCPPHSHFNWLVPRESRKSCIHKLV